MRAGSFGGHQTATLQSNRLQSWAPPPAVLDSDIRILSTDMSQFYGVDTPQYHRKLKSGVLLPLNEYERFHVAGQWTGSHNFVRTYKATGNTASYYSSGGGPFIRGEGADGFIPSVDQMRVIRNQYLDHGLPQKAAARVQSQGFDGLTFLAELHQVKRMFARLARRWIALAKSGKFHNLWLEGRYGWRVLWFDIVEIASLIEKFEERRNRYSERVGTSHAFSSTVVHPQSTWSEHFAFSATETVDCTISCRGHVVADIEPPKVQFSIVKTSWELLTFSFVIDWFIQVGQWLDAAEFLLHNQKHYAATSVKIVYTCQWYTDVNSWVNNATYSTAGSVTCNGIYQSEYYFRVPSTVTLSLQHKLKLDVFKVADLVALFLQLLRRK